MSRDDVVPAGVSAAWDDVIDEAEELSTDYRADGWETSVLHPGDVTTVVGESVALDVLASGEEFDRLRKLTADHTFDRSHVYRRMRGDVALFLLVFEATASEVVVFVPGFARLHDFHQLHEQVGDVLAVHVRPLSDDVRVTFTAEQPERLFPEE